MFYEGLNFAASFNAPLVVLIQKQSMGNFNAPSVKRRKAETLAQKAVAFGIPGIQVDGNDVLAMYVAMKAAAKHAREGKGPVLIEAVTYRLGAHTTSDDPTIYRSNEEVKIWEAKEPMIRFKKYLIDKKFWSEDEDLALDQEHSDFVNKTFKHIEESLGAAKLEDIFKYTYAEMTPQLTEQYQDYKAWLERKDA